MALVGCLLAALVVASCGGTSYPARARNSAALPTPAPPQLLGAPAGSGNVRVAAGYEEVFVPRRTSRTRDEGAWGHVITRRQFHGAVALGLSDDLEIGLLAYGSHTDIASPVQQASDVDPDEPSGLLRGFGFSFRNRLAGSERLGLVWSTELVAMELPYRRTLVRIDDLEVDPDARDGRRLHGDVGSMTTSTGLDGYAHAGNFEFVGGLRLQIHPRAVGSEDVTVYCADSACNDFEAQSRFFYLTAVGLGYFGVGVVLDSIELHLLGFGALDVEGTAGFSTPGAALRVGYRH